MREPSKGVTRELQVGIFIFAACLVIAAFSFRITDTPIFRKGTTLTAYFNDATGIFKNSKVKMAGIDIGVIKAIELEDGKAKVVMLINKGIVIPKGAQVIPRALGILGDKYLEVVVPKAGEVDDGVEKSEPKASEDNSSGSWFYFIHEAWAQEEEDKPMKPEKGNYKEGEVMKSQNAPATLDDLTREMGDVGKDLKAVSSSLRKLVEGQENPKSSLGRTLRNTESLTGNLDATVKENRTHLTKILSSLDRMTEKMEKAFDQFDESKLRGDIKRMADAAGSVSKSVENIEKITSKIERGEGTLGKLINDDSTAVELNHALTSINAIVDRAQRTEILVNMRSEYNLKPKNAKTYVGLGIFPKETTGYLAGIVVDPQGPRTEKIKHVTVAGQPEVVTDTVTYEKTSLKFELQYYKRIWDMAIRLGLIENTGGVATDFYLLKDRFKLTAELFDISREGDRPQLKLYASVRFFEYFYLTAGGTDMISKVAEQKSFFVGLGIRFSDDDLKAVAFIPGVH